MELSKDIMIQFKQVLRESLLSVLLKVFTEFIKSFSSVTQQKNLRQASSNKQNITHSNRRIVNLQNILTPALRHFFHHCILMSGLEVFAHLVLVIL